MRNRLWLLLLGGALVGLTVTVIAARDVSPGRTETPISAAGEKDEEKKKDGADTSRAADRKALQKSSRTFAQAFEKGDAKAIASLWTEEGEYHSDDGTDLHGRAAIGKAYAEFFKNNPKSKIEVEIVTVRFPSRDTAIEEGVLRQKRSGPDFPTSTRYSALHVREDGTWKIASVREWGAAEAKIDDLGWLIGRWVAKTKKGEVNLHFEWNETKSQIRNRFLVKEGKRVVSSGTQVIRLDPETGQLRSWMFDEEGGHGQALWFRDGNRWVQEAVGVLGDGSDTFALNVLTRLNDNEFVWRSTDRTVNEEPVPDTEPIKITRVRREK